MKPAPVVISANDLHGIRWGLAVAAALRELRRPEVFLGEAPESLTGMSIKLKVYLPSNRAGEGTKRRAVTQGCVTVDKIAHRDERPRSYMRITVIFRRSTK